MWHLLCEIGVSHTIRGSLDFNFYFRRARRALQDDRERMHIVFAIMHMFPFSRGALNTCQ